MVKKKIGFKIVSSSVIYPKLLHSQEISMGSISDGCGSVSGSLRKKAALVIAGKTV